MLQFRLKPRTPAPLPELVEAHMVRPPVADTRIMPWRVAFHPTYAEVDDFVVRGLVLHEWPRMMVPGTWADVFDGSLPVTVSQDIVPRDRDIAMDELRDQSAWYHAMLNSGQNGGAVLDYKTAQAAADTERMRNALSGRDEQLFNVRVHFLLRAANKATLDRYTRDLDQLIKGLGGKARVAVFEQDRVLRACMPQASGYATDSLHVVPTTALAYSYPWTQDSILDEAGAFFGIQTAKPEPVYLDLVRRGTLNMTVFGKSSKGKGYTLKNLVLELLLDGFGFIGVDQQETREWEMVCKQAGGDYVIIAPGGSAAINVFEVERLNDDDPSGRSPLEEQVEAVREFVGMLVTRMHQPLDSLENAVLLNAIVRTYARAGIELDRPETHYQKAPTLLDLFNVLREWGDGPSAKSTIRVMHRAGALRHRRPSSKRGGIKSDPTAKNLASRLQPHVTGPMRGLFTNPTTSRRDAPCVFYNIAQVPAAIRPAVLHLVGVEAWRRIRRQERPTIFIADEGYTLIQHDEGREFAERLAVGVRQYWGGLWFVSQQGVGCLDRVRPVYDNSSVHLYFHNPRTDAHAIAERVGLSTAAEDFIVGADEGEYLLEDTDRRIIVGVKMHATDLGDYLATTRPAVLAKRKRAGKRGWAFWQWMET